MANKGVKDKIEKRVGEHAEKTEKVEAPEKKHVTVTPVMRPVVKVSMEVSFRVTIPAKIAIDHRVAYAKELSEKAIKTIAARAGIEPTIKIVAPID